MIDINTHLLTCSTLVVHMNLMFAELLMRTGSIRSIRTARSSIGESDMGDCEREYMEYFQSVLCFSAGVLPDLDTFHHYYLGSSR